MGRRADGRIYLDSYILHKDYRIRLPKAIENNLGAKPGKTSFDVFFDVKTKEIILKCSQKTVVIEQ